MVRPLVERPPGTEMDELTDPEVTLAIAHAPAPTRAGLTMLFALDQRLAGIVASTTEPMIGLMRLAWWREALEKLDRADAPAEPLLQDVARELLPRGVPGALLSGIEDGWTALIDGEVDAEAIARHGRERGGTLFIAAALLLGQADGRAAEAGALWAVADLAHGHGDAGVRAVARKQAVALAARLPGGWPKALRPLGMLATLAARDAAADERRQGHPARLLRMLALRLTGR
jgi:phytoene synthase